MREYVIKKNNVICDLVNSMLKAGGVTIKYCDVRRKGIFPAKPPEWRFKEEAEVFIPFKELRRTEIFLREDDLYDYTFNWFVEDGEGYHIRGVKKIEVHLLFYRYFASNKASFRPNIINHRIFELEVINHDLAHALMLIYMCHKDVLPNLTGEW